MGNRSWGASRPFFSVALVICAAVAVGSAYGGREAPKPRPPNAWVEAAFDLLAAPAVAEPPLPDLDDGRSAVDGRWRHALQRFERDDRAQRPAPGGIVVVGSSSIQQWDALEPHFPRHRIVRRGLGGARLPDCVRFLDRLVLPYQPHLVVVYAGDNDLAEGGSAESVLADYVELVQRVRAVLPATRVAFVSIKPSPLRDALIPEIRRANALVAAYARADPGLDYVDVFDPMLDADGHARAALFRPDGLHLNAEGYALWQDVLASHLD